MIRLVSTFILMWLAPAIALPQNLPFTLILESGTVYDGLGGPPVQTDIGIRGDLIEEIGDLSAAAAAVRIDASGLAVTPGFIDIHSHADRDILYRPEAENYIRQGVTTVIGGPDGSSFFPTYQFLGQVELRPATVNLGTMVGHGTVRRKVIGNENRPPTPEELDEMKRLVAAAMEEGAFGLSSGLKYVPGAYAETEEVVELARVAGRYGGFYKSHMRDEGLELLKSVEETIRIGEEGGLPTQLTHHKVIGHTMWGASEETLRLVDEARARSVDATMDQYPYIASSTSLSILFPSWSLEGSASDLQARMQDPDTRARIKAAIVFNLEKDRGGNNPANVAVAYCAWDSTLNGKNLADILRDRNEPVTVERAAELAMDLQEKGGFQGIFFAMHEDDVRRIMAHPMTMIASDGGIPAWMEGVPHPRNYGTFARVLGFYVREEGVLPFTEAVRKMSSMPAQRLDLQDRGVLREGAFADIAVLDPDTIIDRATFEQPHQYAEGVRYVLVNGQLALDGGEMTGARPGRVLRHGR